MVNENINVIEDIDAELEDGLPPSPLGPEALMDGRTPIGRIEYQPNLGG